MLELIIGRYGAVLLNGGTVEIISLSLGTNGEGANNGIEVSKSVNLAASNNQTKYRYEW